MKPVLEKSNKKVNDAFEKMHGKMKVIKLRNLFIRYLFIGLFSLGVYILTFFINYQGTLLNAIGIGALGLTISCGIKLFLIRSKMMLAKRNQ